MNVKGVKDLFYTYDNVSYDFFVGIKKLTLDCECCLAMKIEQ